MDAEYTEAVPATMEDVLEWMKANKLKPTGHDDGDLARANLARKFTHRLPPFVIGRQGLKPQGVVIDSPHPDTPVAGAMAADMGPPRKQERFTMLHEAKRMPRVGEQAIEVWPAVVETTPAVVSAPVVVTRSVKGLADALFDEIDNVRAGKGDETRIKQICQLSVRIVELMSADIKFQKMSHEFEVGAGRGRMKEITGDE